MELEQELDQKSDGWFECNICLDSANDSVVTLCGHLYCWSCIYKWLYIQTAALPPDEYPRCPVCKAEISHTTLIPLYGRAQFRSTPKSTAFDDLVIPPRPPPCASGTRALLNAASQTHPRSLFKQTSEAVVGMFREMVYARVFGNSPSVYTYTYPNSYHYVGNSSSIRLRRQEMQVNKPLSRISLFLLCCFLLCLFFF